jgi:hypothetical protein
VIPRVLILAGWVLLMPFRAAAGEAETLIAAIQANFDRVADLSCTVTVTARTTYRVAVGRLGPTVRSFRYRYKAPDKTRIDEPDGTVSIVNGDRAWDVSPDGTIRPHASPAMPLGLARVGSSELWSFAGFVRPFAVGCDGWHDGMRTLCLRVPAIPVQGVRRYCIAPESGCVERVRFSDSHGIVFREIQMTSAEVGGIFIPVRTVDTVSGTGNTAVTEQVVGDVIANGGLPDALFLP